MPDSYLWDIRYKVTMLDSASTLLWLVVPDKCNLDQNCPHFVKKNRLYWRSRDVFANVILVMVQFGRGKEKTNRQVVLIMVLLGTDGPVITGLGHVTAHSFGCCFPSLERQRDQCKLKPEQFKQWCLHITAAKAPYVTHCFHWPEICWGCGCHISGFSLRGFITHCKKIILGLKDFALHGQWSWNLKLLLVQLHCFHEFC